MPVARVPLRECDELDRPDELHRRIQELEERLFRLSEASLRINESLDLGTVLQEVVDNACALTGSRYGAITIPGEVFRRPTFIASGLTEEEHQGLWDMPEGLGFFEYLSGLEEPLRVPDVAGHLRGLGMPDFLPAVPVSSLLVAPIRHLGIGVGTIYLAQEAGGREFTPGGRGDPGPLRLPGGDGHRQRPAGTVRNNRPGPTWRR